MTHETSTSGRRPSTEDVPAVSTKASSDPVVHDRDDTGNRAIYNTHLSISTTGSDNTNTLEVPRPNLGYSEGTNSGAGGSTEVTREESSYIASHGSGPAVPAHTATLQPTADARQPLGLRERFYKRSRHASSAKRFFKKGWAKISSLFASRVKARARPEPIAKGIENPSQQNPSTTHEPNTNQVFATEAREDQHIEEDRNTVNPARGIPPSVPEHHSATESQQNTGPSLLNHDSSYPLPTNATSDESPENSCLNCPVHCRSLSTGAVPSIPPPFQHNRRQPAVDLEIEALIGTSSTLRPPGEGSRCRGNSDPSLLRHIGALFGSRESSRVRSRRLAPYPSVVDPSLSSRPASGAFRSNHADHALANGIQVPSAHPSAADPAEEEVNQDGLPSHAG